MGKRLAELKFQEEITQLNTKIRETEELLKGELKTREKLISDAANRAREITVLEEAIAQEERQHQQKKPQFIAETSILEAEKRKKLVELQDQERELSSYVSSIDIQERENEQLQLRLNARLDEYKNLSTYRKEIIDDRRQQNFDARMMMDATVRTRLEEITMDYQLKASKKLDVDAANASQENRVLHNEIHELEDKSRFLIAEEHEAYELLRRLHIEQEVISVTADIQEQKVLQLQYETSNTQKSIEALAAHLQKVKSEIEKLQETMDVKSEQMNFLHLLESSRTSVTTKRKKTQNNVIKCTQKLVLDTLALSEIERREKSLQIVSGLSPDNNHRGRRQELFSRSLSRRNSTISNLNQMLRSPSVYIPPSVPEKRSTKEVQEIDYDQVWKST